jgi:hypothetical protein
MPPAQQPTSPSPKKIPQKFARAHNPPNPRSQHTNPSLGIVFLTLTLTLTLSEAEGKGKGEGPAIVLWLSS